MMFENCSCQLVCPGHMHFSNACTHERCVGYWAIRIDEGAYGDVPLSGLKAFIAFDSPQHMIEGNWTEVVIIDEAASPDAAGGARDHPHRPGRRLVGPAREVRLPLARHPLPARSSSRTKTRTKRARIPGLLDTSITEIKGRDRSQPVTFENIFNQIHGSTQVIALGQTHYDDGVIAIRTEKSHGLHSRFEWAVA